MKQPPAMLYSALARTLGRALKAARLDAGMSQAAVAEHLATHRPIVARNERGIHLQRADLFFAHARVVGLTFQDACAIIDIVVAEHGR